MANWFREVLRYADKAVLFVGNCAYCTAWAPFGYHDRSSPSMRARYNAGLVAYERKIAFEREQARGMAV